MYWNDECCTCVYFDDDYVYKGWTGIMHYCNRQYTFTKAKNPPCSEYYWYNKRTSEEIDEFEEEERTGVVRPKKIQPPYKYNYNNNNNRSVLDDDFVLEWICKIAEKRRKKKAKKKKRT